jgi:hypothetical protein
VAASAFKARMQVIAKTTIATIAFAFFVFKVMSASNIEWGEIMKLQVYLNRKRWSGQYVLLSPGEMTSGLVKVQWEDGVS